MSNKKFEPGPNVIPKSEIGIFGLLIHEWFGTLRLHCFMYNKIMHFLCPLQLYIKHIIIVKPLVHNLTQPLVLVSVTLYKFC